MPVNHTVSGSLLVFSLTDELKTIHTELARTGTRTARTLLRQGALRATLIGIAPGGELREHHADGPITVHVLEGEITFEVEGKAHELGTGSLLSLAPGLVHAVASRSGGVFLLTLAAPAAG